MTLKNNELKFNAFELNLIDLDEYGACAEFKDLIEKRKSANIQKIELDLQKCWVEYSHSYLFLDVALQLLKAEKGKSKTLLIKTSVNLGSPEFMAVFIFRLSKIIGCEDGDKPIDVFNKVKKFCIESNVNIVIDAIPFPQKPEDQRNQSFDFSQSNAELA